MQKRKIWENFLQWVLPCVLLVIALVLSIYDFNNKMDAAIQTVAHFYLADGTYVCTAFSSVIDPAQYDQTRGTEAAISKARVMACDKLFELEGWRLRNHS
jgi:hypothetical protein